MKIQKLSIYNFANYGKVTVDFSDTLTYLIGVNGSGKSTIGITAIWFVMCGIAEKQGASNPLIGERFRFIGNQSAKAQGQIVFKDEKTGNVITVTRTLGKDGSKVEFKGELPGVELNQEWLTSLFNEFLIAPKRFAELTPINQARAIGIDTGKFDADMVALKQKATGINAVIKSMGEISPVPKAEHKDIEPLKIARIEKSNELIRGKKLISDTLTEQYRENQKANKEAREAWEKTKKEIDEGAYQVYRHNGSVETAYNVCSSAAKTLTDNGYQGSEVNDFLLSIQAQLKPSYKAIEHYPLEPVYINPEYPDQTPLQTYEEEARNILAELDREIEATNANNQNAFLYTEYLKKVDAKQSQVDLLAANKEAQKTKEAEKIAFVKGFDLPFDGMGIDDSGGLTYKGRYITAQYFSSGELIQIIVTLMSRKNPELKYVFLQDFNLLDEDRQRKITDSLEAAGFQLVIELVGKETIADRTCILLKDCKQVDTYNEVKKEELV
jgi:hypothetical protein